MTELLKDLVVRVLCGSMICFIALVIAGDGPNREPVRLCCAAIMIILILSNNYHINLNLDYLSDIKSDLQEDISSELEKAKDSEIQQIVSTIEKNITDHMYKEGIYFEIELTYIYDEKIIITGAVIRNLNDIKNKNVISYYLINNLGLKESAIIFE